MHIAHTVNYRLNVRIAGIRTRRNCSTTSRQILRHVDDICMTCVTFLICIIRITIISIMIEEMLCNLARRRNLSANAQ